MRTVTKKEMLLYCVKNRVGFTKKDWFAKVFAIPKLFKEETIKLEDGSICMQPDGPYLVMGEEKELLKISDYIPNEPLFRMKDPIKVTSETMSNITGEIDTLVGRLVLNAILFTKELEKKIPFINKYVSGAGDIEKILSTASNNIQDPVTVEEIIGVIDRMNFIDSLGLIINIATSKRAISAAPGIKEYSRKLITELGDDIHDPVKLVELEKKLLDYDQKWLADDPVARDVFKSKAVTGRFKMYCMQGKVNDFVKDGSNDGIIKRSISDGMNPDPKEFMKYLNESRFGSEARGSKTALGGVTYKRNQQALGTIRISPEPCNTSRGLKKIFSKADVNFGVGRYRKDGNKWALIRTKEEAESLLGKEVEIRSPMYCRREGNEVCYACMSVRYKNIPNGIINLAADVSSAILNMFMKLMHGTKVEVAVINEDDLFN